MPNKRVNAIVGIWSQLEELEDTDKQEKIRQTVNSHLREAKKHIGLLFVLHTITKMEEATGRDLLNKHATAFAEFLEDETITTLAECSNPRSFEEQNGNNQARARDVITILTEADPKDAQYGLDYITHRYRQALDNNDGQIDQQKRMFKQVARILTGTYKVADSITGQNAIDALRETTSFVQNNPDCAREALNDLRSDRRAVIKQFPDMLDPLAETITDQNDNKTKTRS